MSDRVCSSGRGRGSASVALPSFLRQQRLADLRHVLARGAFRLGEFQVEALKRFDYDARYQEPREPFVVRWNDMPRRLRPAGPPDRVLVGGHVFRPELALGDVSHGELPTFGGIVEA